MTITIYTLILIALWPSGDINSMTPTGVQYTDRAECEKSGDAWDAAGQRLSHLCLESKVTIL